MQRSIFATWRQRSLVSGFVLALFANGSALFGCSGESEKNGDSNGEAGDASGGMSGSSGSSGSGTGGNAGSDEGGSGGSTMGGSSGTGGGPDGCVPTTCEAEGKNCGRIDDGCGRVLECGACADGCTCGETVENVCSGDGARMTVTNYGQAGRSSGFSGTDAQYNEMYDLPCASVDDCLDPCATRGGTEEMCAASICVDSTSDYCLPATVWRNTMALRTEGTDYTDGAELVLVNDPYADFLLVTDFKFEIPESAEILGISATIRRAGGSSIEAGDGAVRLIKGGVMGDADRSRSAPWGGPMYENAVYGGPEDLWGETWTPADLNSEDFGVALNAIYTDTAGNGRAYVDIVYVTVNYATSCE
jgi:hypothetical protein